MKFWTALLPPLFLAFFLLSPARDLEDDQESSNCVVCHAGLSERLAKSVSRWKRSVHALARVGCSDCHGGDPAAPRGGKEHTRFPGRPSSSEVATFCGRCHSDAKAQYSSSGHSKIHGGKPVNTCVDCHGAHDVGNPPTLFRLSEYCGSCHGLEYLPALPAGVRSLIESSDRLTVARLATFRESSDFAQDSDRKAVVRQVGDFVHRATLDVTASEVESWARRMNEVALRLAKR